MLSSLEVTTHKMEPDTYTQPAFSTQPSITPVKEPMEEEETDTTKVEMTTGRIGWKKFGNFRSGKGNKLSKKIRKKRLNYRLKNMLTPKNAMMVLHELYPDMKCTIADTLTLANQTCYTVEIVIENKAYRGQGISKLTAKQSACEIALRDIVLEKMAKSNSKPLPDDLPKQDDLNLTELPDLTIKHEQLVPQQQQQQQPPPPPPPPPQQQQQEQPQEEELQQQPVPDNGEILMDQSEEVNNKKKERREEDVPWQGLASYALFKLFSEWQAQGIPVPGTGAVNKTSVQQTLLKPIPDDANQKHPVQLLSQLRPGLLYTESRSGLPPNLLFSFSCTLNGAEFKGEGTNKKEAKKECAKQVLISLGVRYD